MGKQDSEAPIPRHLGLILDGNRRWAKEQGLPTLEGHRQGYDNLKKIVQAALDAGVEYISAYIFSTENWNRTKEEVGYLMDLAAKMATKDAHEMAKKNIKIVVLGAEDRVPPKVMRAWRQVEAESQDNTGGTLALCFNYGGLREVVEAARTMVGKGFSEDDITEESLLEHLYHPEIPRVDLVIRTSGEQRISNFMLPRVGYSELYFTEKNWPAFTVSDLHESLDWYAKRGRRYGA